jgi:hypothetical protein
MKEIPIIKVDYGYIENTIASIPSVSGALLPNYLTTVRNIYDTNMTKILYPITPPQILPFVEVQIRGGIEKALIDTGANRSTINMSLIQEYGIPINGKELVAVHGKTAELRDNYLISFHICDPGHNPQMTINSHPILGFDYQHNDYNLIIGCDILSQFHKVVYTKNDIKLIYGEED